VAAQITFSWIGRPLLDRLGGASYQPPVRLFAKSGFALRKKLGRREYVRVVIDAKVWHSAIRKTAPHPHVANAHQCVGRAAEESTQLSVGDPVSCIALALLHG